jgi:DNA polymerase III alpha subunit
MLLAQNERGYLNLCELSSFAYLEIDASEDPHVGVGEDLREYSEGLILLSGGPDGPVDHLLAAGKVKEGRAALAEMKRVFGDRFYVELQRHGAADPRRRRRANWSPSPMSRTRRSSPPTTSTSNMPRPMPRTTCCCASPTAASSARTNAGG